MDKPIFLEATVGVWLWVVVVVVVVCVCERECVSACVSVYICVFGDGESARWC